MQEFHSMAAFAEHLIVSELHTLRALEVGLEKAAVMVEKQAKAEIGHLQPAAGEFHAWAELAESTIEDKTAKGYAFNGDYNPLLRTGKLLESIKHHTEEFEAVIGSDDEVMMWQELGTAKIPPRSVLGMAAVVCGTDIKEILGSHLLQGILQKRIVGDVEALARD